jgi:hypothetical protein
MAFDGRFVSPVKKIHFAQAREGSCCHVADLSEQPIRFGRLVRFALWDSMESRGMRDAIGNIM